MSTVLYKHLDREFRTEHKLFLLSVGKGGQSIKIVERTRVNDFILFVELGGANWLCAIILEAVEFNGNNGFFRKFRGNSYVLLVMTHSNRRGRFLRIEKVHEGKLTSIMVPNGFDSTGWSDLRRNLLSMLGKERLVVEGRNEGNLFGEKSQFIGPMGVQKKLETSSGNLS